MLCIYDIFLFFSFLLFLLGFNRKAKENFVEFFKQRYSDITKMAAGIFHLNFLKIQPDIAASSGGQKKKVRDRCNKNKF
jgi:hypothetical protein